MKSDLTDSWALMPYAFFHFAVASLYHKSHPEFPSYLYLVAPISLVFLNPIGFGEFSK
jgi:hypothetical protein